MAPSATAESERVDARRSAKKATDPAVGGGSDDGGGREREKRGGGPSDEKPKKQRKRRHRDRRRRRRNGEAAAERAEGREGQNHSSAEAAGASASEHEPILEPDHKMAKAERRSSRGSGAAAAAVDPLYTIFEDQEDGGGEDEKNDGDKNGHGENGRMKRLLRGEGVNDSSNGKTNGDDNNPNEDVRRRRRRRQRKHLQEQEEQQKQQEKQKQQQKQQQKHLANGDNFIEDHPKPREETLKRRDKNIEREEGDEVEKSRSGGGSRPQRKQMQDQEQQQKQQEKQQQKQQHKQEQLQNQQKKHLVNGNFAEDHPKSWGEVIRRRGKNWERQEDEEEDDESETSEEDEGGRRRSRRRSRERFRPPAFIEFVREDIGDDDRDDVLRASAIRGIVDEDKGDTEAIVKSRARKKIHGSRDWNGKDDCAISPDVGEKAGEYENDERNNDPVMIRDEVAADGDAGPIDDDIQSFSDLGDALALAKMESLKDIHHDGYVKASQAIDNGESFSKLEDSLALAKIESLRDIHDDGGVESSQTLDDGESFSNLGDALAMAKMESLRNIHDQVDVESSDRSEDVLAVATVESQKTPRGEGANESLSNFDGQSSLDSSQSKGSSGSRGAPPPPPRRGVRKMDSATTLRVNNKGRRRARDSENKDSSSETDDDGEDRAMTIMRGRLAKMDSMRTLPDKQLMPFPEDIMSDESCDEDESTFDGSNPTTVTEHYCRKSSVGSTYDGSNPAKATQDDLLNSAASLLSLGSDRGEKHDQNSRLLHTNSSGGLVIDNSIYNRSNPTVVTEDFKKSASSSLSKTQPSHDNSSGGLDIDGSSPNDDIRGEALQNHQNNESQEQLDSIDPFADADGSGLTSRDSWEQKASCNKDDGDDESDLLLRLLRSTKNKIGGKTSYCDQNQNEKRRQLSNGIVGEDKPSANGKVDDDEESDLFVRLLRSASIVDRNNQFKFLGQNVMPAKAAPSPPIDDDMQSIPSVVGGLRASCSHSTLSAISNVSSIASRSYLTAKSAKSLEEPDSSSARIRKAAAAIPAYRGRAYGDRGRRSRAINEEKALDIFDGDSSSGNDDDSSSGSSSNSSNTTTASNSTSRSLRTETSAGPSDDSELDSPSSSNDSSHAVSIDPAESPKEERSLAEENEDGEDHVSDLLSGLNRIHSKEIKVALSKSAFALTRLEELDATTALRLSQRGEALRLSLTKQGDHNKSRGSLQTSIAQPEDHSKSDGHIHRMSSSQRGKKKKSMAKGSKVDSGPTRRLPHTKNILKSDISRKNIFLNVEEEGKEAREKAGSAKRSFQPKRILQKMGSRKRIVLDKALGKEGTLAESDSDSCSSHEVEASPPKLKRMQLQRQGSRKKVPNIESGKDHDPGQDDRDDFGDNGEEIKPCPTKPKFRSKMMLMRQASYRRKVPNMATAEKEGRPAEAASSTGGSNGDSEEVEASPARTMPKKQSSRRRSAVDSCDDGELVKPFLARPRLHSKRILMRQDSYQRKAPGLTASELVGRSVGESRSSTHIRGEDSEEVDLARAKRLFHLQQNSSTSYRGRSGGDVESVKTESSADDTGEEKSFEDCLSDREEGEYSSNQASHQRAHTQLGEYGQQNHQFSYRAHRQQGVGSAPVHPRHDRVSDSASSMRPSLQGSPSQDKVEPPSQRDSINCGKYNDYGTSQDPVSWDDLEDAIEACRRNSLVDLGRNSTRVLQPENVDYISYNGRDGGDQDPIDRETGRHSFIAHSKRSSPAQCTRDHSQQQESARHYPYNGGGGVGIERQSQALEPVSWDDLGDAIEEGLLSSLSDLNYQVSGKQGWRH